MFMRKKVPAALHPPLAPNLGGIGGSFFPSFLYNRHEDDEYVEEYLLHKLLEKSPFLVRYS